MKYTKANTLYEFETLRTDMTPKAFYGYVKRELKRRCNIDLESTWCDGFRTWSGEDGTPETDTRTPEEICKTKAYEWQYYLRGAYNFIMEFDFYDETTGNGYCYIWEAIR